MTKVISSKTFAVVDFYHVDSPIAYIRILEPICKKLVIITNDSIAGNLREHELLKSRKINWLILEDDGEHNSEIISQGLKRQSVDICIFSTIEKHFCSYLRVLHSYDGIKLVVIHNANFWFKKSRRLKVFLRPRNPAHRAKLEIIRKASALIVLDENVKTYIGNEFRYKGLILEFSLGQVSPKSFNTQFRIQKERLHLVVPGSIEQKRKDYRQVLRVMRTLSPHMAQLTFLGKPKGLFGKEIINDIEQLRQQSYDIRYYSEFVHQSEFDKQLSSASIILLPIRSVTSFAGIPEEYGVSKISGSLYDAINACKPAIVPRSLNLSAKLSERFLQFATDEELAHIITHLSSSINYQIEIERIQKIKYWELENVRLNFIEGLVKIIGKSCSRF